MHLPSRQLIFRRLIRQPQVVGTQGKLKTLWQHADDRVRLAVDDQRAAHYVRIAAEPALPQTVIEDRDFWSTGLILTGLERAADDGIHAEHLEEVRAHCRRAHAFGFTLAAQDRASAGVSGEPVEHVVLLVVLVV